MVTATADHPDRAVQPLIEALRQRGHLVVCVWPESGSRAPDEVAQVLDDAYLRQPGLVGAAGLHLRAKLTRTADLTPSRSELRHAFLTNPARQALSRDDVDLVVACRLTAFDDFDADVVRAARQAGLPTAAVVRAWGDLTRHGDLKCVPDKLFVWNAAQAAEARYLQDIDPGRIIEAGAFAYDPLLVERLPAAALIARSNTICYLASSTWVAPKDSEVRFFRDWLLNLRAAAEPGLREANVVVRPHPSNPAPWSEFATPDRAVRILPPGNPGPDLTAMLAEAGAATGLNTGAVFEAGLAGVPFVVLAAPRFAEMQEGVPHFHQLREAGLADVHRDTATYFQALARALSRQERSPRHGAAERFLWPHGRAADVIIDGLETLAQAPRPQPVPAVASRPAPRRPMPGAAVRRTPLLQAVAGAEGERLEDPMLAEADAAIATAVAGERPILVGPWLSEVGFESLYWIPFLRWLRKAYQLDRRRLVVVSRGGVEGWYTGLLGRYADVFDFRSLAQVQQSSLARQLEVGVQKQIAATPFEQALLQDVARRLGIADFGVLHPKIMYRLFHRYWDGTAGHRFIDAVTRFAATAAPAAKPVGLPDRYVAARFYFRPSFPDTNENRRLVQTLIATVAERIPVVLIGSTTAIDDHHDFTAESNSRVIAFDPMLTPRTNLAAQSRVIADAEAFVGAYGGLCYVAAGLGRPAFGLESDGQHNLDAHTELARRKLGPLGGRLHVLSPLDFASLGLLVG